MQAVFTGGAQPPCNASAAHVPESNWSYPVGQTFRLPNLMMVRKAMASLRMSFPAQLPHTYVPISSAAHKSILVLNSNLVPVVLVRTMESAPGSMYQDGEGVSFNEEVVRKEGSQEGTASS